MLALRLALLAALAAPLTAEVPAAVVIVMDIEEPHSRHTMEAMQDELEFLMRRLELRFDWRPYKEALGREIQGELAVVRFKGPCRIPSQQAGPPDYGSRTLAATHVADGHVLPYIDVYCDRVRQLAEPALSAGNFPSRELLLGRALGRVLAHELYHLFTGATGHHEGGLAKRLFTPQDLIQPGVEFDKQEQELLGESFTNRWPSESPPR